MTFPVVAIVAAHNESDIIESVVADLIAQEIGVYFLDDGSTDDTLRKVQPFLDRGVIGIERFAEPATGSVPGRFEWERILSRKTELARTLDAEWFIHHDADEFRESPWPSLSLRQAIQRVDTLGFNAIDFALFNFWPVYDHPDPGDDIRRSFTFYAPAAPYDRLQVRCWKKTAEIVDLVSSGGHEARFSGRRVFPLHFILRHYPIRGQSHGERKVRERRARFLEEERGRGWHVQYDDVPERRSFVRDPAELTPYDPESVRLSLTLRPRRIGELEETLAGLRTDFESLRRDRDSIRTDWDAVRADRDAIRSDRDALRTDRDVLRVHHDALLTDRDALRAGYRAVRTELETLREDLRTLAADRESVRDALDVARAEAVALHREIARQSDELHELQRRLDAKGVDIERLRAGVVEGARLLDEFHRSLSWRWTAPARAAYRAITGEGRRRR